LLRLVTGATARFRAVDPELTRSSPYEALAEVADSKTRELVVTLKSALLTPETVHDEIE
jgi:hypothetical protein